MAKPIILIVDDEDQFRESLSEVLEEEFYVLTAPCAKEGLAKINKNPLSLILLDLRMPGVTGVELLEILRSQNNNTPVLILTGNSCQDWAEKCADLNVQGYVKKPIDVEKLICRIKKLPGMDDSGVLREIWGDKYGAKKASISPLVDKALCHIMHNCRKDIDREKVASFLDVTPQYLSTKFYKETGIHLIEFINVVKVNKSKELLKSGDRRLKDISASVGIEDESYFCKLFKEYTGLSPTEYRNRA